MPKLKPRKPGIHSARRPRNPGPTVIPSTDPLLDCGPGCPGECKAFRDALEYLKYSCRGKKYAEFEERILELERKLVDTYWSCLGREIILCGLTPRDSSFLLSVISDDPFLRWRYIGVIPFDGVSNPPIVDRILERILTVEDETGARDALVYVNLLHGLQIIARYTREKEIRDMLHLFYRRYAEAFGSPYRCN
ncbi:uncharacterized protein N7496_011763 [Penicillium cataractarum]|uniref:Uncharacterized protein n=1 Tax=Penicillium cataractarum TaxID=2100454 RepID=A0A9W9UY12_9EURO|nr:uncharacterized protein N7496_011763 [Penicillium cataractarum]KAJ5359350.1 hypothetical protein N7496_011763 [Penicillium cataractarum]